ncbi:hypothetical protein TNCV_3538301 [Trichonephila clavipes]|nr:hypothetical protein TNCV_3538301 [Trichonephila clavipes]
MPDVTHHMRLPLDTCQNQVSEQLLELEYAAQEYFDDIEHAENYRDRYIEMCSRVDLKIRETVVLTETERKSFKLPKIELKKFSSEANDFCPSGELASENSQ